MSAPVAGASIVAAIKWSHRGIELWGRAPSFVVALGIAHARTGEHEAARARIRELEEIARTRHIPPVWFAVLHMNLRDADRAFEALEAAVAAHDVYLLQLEVGPQFDPIRGDPRYAALLRRLESRLGRR